MDRVRETPDRQLPRRAHFLFQSGSLQDAILNQGMPAPIDVQVNTRDLDLTYSTAQDLARASGGCRESARSTFRRT